MNIILWIGLFSFIIYPTFVGVTVFANYFPNTKLSKWWKKHVIDNNEEYD
jgi:hypothetical protein